MAVKTTWSISFACGHSEDRHLSGKRSDERAGYARWLAGKDCTHCWRTAQADAGELSSQQWLERMRAEEAEAIDGWEQRAGVPALDGSEKAIACARRVWHAVRAGAYDTLVAEADRSDEQWVAVIEVPARVITRASWWINIRDTDTDTADVAELVTAARATPAVACENDA